MGEGLGQRTRERLRYWQRLGEAYLRPATSQLAFWHEQPEPHPGLEPGELGPYPMSFAEKADYPGPFDDNGIPLLDYRGRVGKQYNPTAVAQYGLAHFSRWSAAHHARSREIFLACCDWLVEALERTPQGTLLLPHRFDFEYFQPLRSPWYSGLAQGSALSALVRAHRETGAAIYENAARELFRTLARPVDQGGVLHFDDAGDPWIEEYLCEPPTHILNGFIWALWGLYDHAVWSGEEASRQLADACTRTLEKNLPRYDLGFWSLYELSPQRLKSPASPYYHQLHCVQLEIMYRLTGAEVFRVYAERWAGHRQSRLKRTAAWLAKAAFKVVYY